MNRGEIVARVKSRIGNDTGSDTKTLIENFINEAKRDIEQIGDGKRSGFSWLWDRKKLTLPASTPYYNLPSTLIQHHKWKLQLKDLTEDKYNDLTEVSEEYFTRTVSEEEAEEVAPVYYLLRGSVLQFYPVPNVERTLRFEGYFYSDDWAIGSGGDASDNYMTQKYPNLLIEAVVYRIHTHKMEPENAAIAYQEYLQRLNGDGHGGVMGMVPSEFRMKIVQRKPRAKTLRDYSMTEQINIRKLG